jgi:hypothetical protein
MTTILQFKPAVPDTHISGEARCLSCKHKWVAVAPVETVWLECPACALEHGRFYYHFEPEAHWQCGCGNDLFYCSDDGVVCPCCGKWQEFN